MGVMGAVCQGRAAGRGSHEDGGCRKTAQHMRQGGAEARRSDSRCGPQAMQVSNRSHTCSRADSRVAGAKLAAGHTPRGAGTGARREQRRTAEGHDQPSGCVVGRVTRDKCLADATKERKGRGQDLVVVRAVVGMGGGRREGDGAGQGRQERTSLRPLGLAEEGWPRGRGRRS
jgi:hypothetical protein